MGRRRSVGWAAEFVVGGVWRYAVPELLFEATQLGHVVHGVVKRWLAAETRSEEMADRLREIEATHWKSRMFVVALEDDLAVWVLGAGRCVCRAAGRG